MSRAIEKGIPIPPGSGRVMRFPELLELDIGDSFLTSAAEAEAIQRAVYQQHRTRKDRIYTTRTLTTGVRVWRKA